MARLVVGLTLLIWFNAAVLCRLLVRAHRQALCAAWSDRIDDAGRAYAAAFRTSAGDDLAAVAVAREFRQARGVEEAGVCDSGGRYIFHSDPRKIGMKVLRSDPLFISLSSVAPVRVFDFRAETGRWSLAVPAEPGDGHYGFYAGGGLGPLESEARAFARRVWIAAFWGGLLAPACCWALVSQLLPGLIDYKMRPVKADSDEGNDS